MQKKLTNLSFGKFILPVFLFLISFSLINFAEAADDNKAIVSDVSNPLVIRAQSGLTTFYSRLQFLPTVNSFKLNALSIDNNAAKSVTIFDYLASPTLFQMLDGNLNYNPTTKFIGIGATSPAAKLDVGGTFKVTGALNSVVLDKLAGTGNRIVMTDSGGSLYAGVVTDTTNYWSPNGTHIFNNNTGNVGIGISAPGAKLDVAGAIRTNNQLISTVANGTAPLVVTSKTLVSNLNVDQVDGFSASDLQFFQSDRDFATGTLIKTDINYSASSGEPFLLEIEGNSYGSQYPFNTKIQGYIYSDTIISKGGVSIGTPISQLVAFNYDGKLCFWFPRQSYWQGFSVFVNSSYSGVKKNRLVSITSEAKPTEITKEVSFNIIESAIIGGTTNYLSKFSGNKSIINSLIFDNGTYVGISKTNPGYKLDVAGDANFAGQIHGVSVPTQGTDAANKNYVDSSFASSSAENLWAGSLTGNIWNKNTGKVGIGITNPGIYQLFVNGPTYINGASTIFGVATINTGIELANGGGRYVKYYGSDDGYKTQMQTTATSGYGVYGPVSGDWALYNRFSGANTRGWIWQNGTTNVAGLSLGGNMQIAGNFNSLGAGNNYFAGNLGVGTSNPGNKLAVYGGDIQVIGTSTSAYFKANDTTNGVNMWFGVSSTGRGFIGAVSNHALGFRTNNTDRLFIDASGNIGIGTTAPGYKLDVDGGVDNQVVDVSNGRIIGLSTIPLTATEAVSRQYLHSLFDEIQNVWTANGNNINNSNTGNVGVGVTAPTKKLDVAGDFQLPVTVGPTNPSGVIYKNGSRFIHDFSYGLNSNNITPDGENIFIGKNSGNFSVGSLVTASSYGSYNIGLGGRTLEAVNQAYGNVAVGHMALKSTVTGYNNVAVGFQSMQNSNHTSHDTAVGTYTLENSSGSYNSAFGAWTMRQNTSGVDNSGFGSSALQNNTTGAKNSALGRAALVGLTGGSGNSALGSYAGARIANSSINTKSDDSIFIGNDTKAQAINQTNQIVIGSKAIGLGSNSVVLGNDSIATTALKGKVGIGTTKPEYDLEVMGSTSSPATLSIASNDTTYVTGDIISTLRFDRARFNPNLRYPAAAISAFYVNAPYGHAGLSFQIPYNGSDSLREVMILTHNGNLDLPFGGIGAKSLYIDNDNPILNMSNTSVQSTSNPDYNIQSIIAFRDSNYNAKGFIKYRYEYPGLGDSLNFLVGNSENMTIANTGNVGIANTNPAARLTVSGGNIFITDPQITPSTTNAVITKGYLDSSLAPILATIGVPIWTTSAGGTYNVGLGSVAIGVSSPQSGYKLTVAGSIYADGFVYSTSDARLKHDVKTLGEEDYQKILKLRPVSFTYNKDNVKGLGFIAQELEEYYPEAVKSSGPDGMKAISYTNLISPTIVAVQEQQKKIDQQETLIHILLDRVNKLENKVK